MLACCACYFAFVGVCLVCICFPWIACFVFVVVTLLLDVFVCYFVLLVDYLRVCGMSGDLFCCCCVVVLVGVCGTCFCDLPV